MGTAAAKVSRSPSRIRLLLAFVTRSKYLSCIMLHLWTWLSSLPNTPEPPPTHGLSQTKKRLDSAKIPLSLFTKRLFTSLHALLRFNN